MNLFFYIYNDTVLLNKNSKIIINNLKRNISDVTHLNKREIKCLEDGNIYQGTFKKNVIQIKKKSFLLERKEGQLYSDINIKEENGNSILFINHYLNWFARLMLLMFLLIPLFLLFILPFFIIENKKFIFSIGMFIPFLFLIAVYFIHISFLKNVKYRKKYILKWSLNKNVPEEILKY